MSANWWANKLAGQPSNPKPLRPPTPVARPTSTPAPVAGATTPATSYSPGAPTQQTQGTCPECGSGNFGGRPPRCFDCGATTATDIYGNPRDFRNSSQGMTGGTGPITPAVQIPSSGYQPGNIVARVD